jgi:PEP-CTERM motif
LNRVKTCCGFLVFTLLSMTSAQAEVVTLRSGNGSIGGTDSLVTMLVGPPSTPFASPFVGADFAAAQGGPSAFIINPNGAWIVGLPGDPAAKWIDTAPIGSGSANTALYAISFNLAVPFSSATLDFHFAVDNQLGGGPNEGVFLNGTAISGDSTGGNFNSEFILPLTDVTSLLAVGANTLYVNATNLGGPAGLLFRATITTVEQSGSSTPEPSSLALMGLGGFGLLYYRSRGRRRLV